MSIASVVVTKPGGLTTSESLASELPIIIVNPIPGQEEENAEFLVAKGAGVWIHSQDNPEEILVNLFKNNNLNIMKQSAKLLSKKNSTKEICEILLSS